MHHDLTYSKKILPHFCWELLSKTSMISNTASKQSSIGRTSALMMIQKIGRTNLEGSLLAEDIVGLEHHGGNPNHDEET
jgi:hypothetical protein